MQAAMRPGLPPNDMSGELESPPPFWRAPLRNGPAREGGREGKGPKAEAVGEGGKGTRRITGTSPHQPTTTVCQRVTETDGRHENVSDLNIASRANYHK